MPIIASSIIEVCVFRFINSGPEYLLLRRAPDERIYPNIWQLVSGSIEGSEKAYEAAVRELREETGFTPEILWTVPFVNVFYDHAYDSMVLSPFFAAQVGPGLDPVLSSEHTEHAWLELKVARSQLVWPGQKSGLDIVHNSIVSGAQASGLTRIPFPL